MARAVYELYNTAPCLVSIPGMKQRVKGTARKKKDCAVIMISFEDIPPAMWTWVKDNLYDATDGVYLICDLDDPGVEYTGQWQTLASV